MKFVIDHSVAFLYKCGYYRLVSAGQRRRIRVSLWSESRRRGHGGHSWEDGRCRGHHHLRGGERADRGGERCSQWHEIRARWEWQGFWWGLDEESLWCQGSTRTGRTSWRSWCLPASASTWWTASPWEYPPCSVGIKDEPSAELLFVMMGWRLNDIMVANCHPEEQQLSVITLSWLPGSRVQRSQLLHYDSPTSASPDCLTWRHRIPGSHRRLLSTQNNTDLVISRSIFQNSYDITSPRTQHACPLTHSTPFLGSPRASHCSGSESWEIKCSS